jgi:glycosyltransferase involved in cell wall biosynthesis
MGIGGTERQLANLLQGLDKNLFAPLLITIHEYPECHEIPCEHFLFRTRKLLSMKALINIIRIASLLKRKKVQLVQAFFFDAAAVGILAARIAGVPIVILSRRDMGFWQTPPRHAVMKILNRLSDRLLVNSDSVLQRIVQAEKVPPEKVHVIHNGIDSLPYNDCLSPADVKKSMGIAGDAPVVGIVSNLNRHVKRVDLILRAADLVLKSAPETKFVIVGEGELRRELENKGKALGLDGAVRFLGSMNSAHALLRAFDVGVNCSDSEGLSNAVLEYMAAGLPAVVSAVPGNCELVEDGVEGLHFKPGDFVSLADRISLLVQNSALRRRMGEKGRERVRKQFTAGVMIHRHMDYYKELLQRI